VISQVAYHLGPLLYGQYILYHVLPSAIELIIAFGIIFGLNECPCLVGRLCTLTTDLKFMNSCIFFSPSLL